MRPLSPSRGVPAALFAALCAVASLVPVRTARAQDAPAAPAPVAPAPGAQTGPAEVPSEVRGVWVVRTDLTSAAAVNRVVAHARSNGLNTLFIQCRGRGDAYYCNGLEPRAQALCKCAASFDPLALAIREGHGAGMKVHAWVNACYIWSDAHAPDSPQHIARAHRDWLAVDRSGRRRAIGDKEVFICPGNPGARAHLVDVCRDIAHRYEVDGLQLDYIRYADQNLCYCDGCLQRFADYLIPKVGQDKVASLRGRGRLALVQAYAPNWRQFRREQVTSLVAEIRKAVKAERPRALLSAATISWGSFPGDFSRTEAYNLVAQDWFGWIRAGLVDAVCPMTYQTNTTSFARWVQGVQRSHPGFPVWFGIGAFLFGPDSAAAKIRTVRQAGSRGWVLFSYTAVTHHGTNDAYLRALKARVLPARTAAAR